MVEYNLGSVRARIGVSFVVEAVLCGALAGRAEAHVVAVAVLAAVMLVVAQVQLAGYAALGQRGGGELALGALCRWRMAEEKPLRMLLGGMAASVLLALLAGGLVVLVGGGEPRLCLSVLLEAEIPELLTQRSTPGVALGLAYLLRVSALWALVNVLPLFPYDGGAALGRVMGGRRGVYVCGMLLAAGLALGALALGWWLVAVYMLFIGLGNYVRAYIGADESIKRS